MLKMKKVKIVFSIMLVICLTLSYITPTFAANNNLDLGYEVLKSAYELNEGNFTEELELRTDSGDLISMKITTFENNTAIYETTINGQKSIVTKERDYNLIRQQLVEEKKRESTPAVNGVYPAAKLVYVGTYKYETHYNISTNDTATIVSGVITALSICMPLSPAQTVGGFVAGAVLNNIGMASTVYIKGEFINYECYDAQNYFLGFYRVVSQNVLYKDAAHTNVLDISNFEFDSTYPYMF